MALILKSTLESPSIYLPASKLMMDGWIEYRKDLEIF